MLDLRTRLACYGGFTVKIEHCLVPTEYVTSGYALSLHPEHEVKLDADKLSGHEVAHAMIGYVIDHSELFRNPNTYFGAWYDDTSDIVYLDVSTVVDDRAKALDLAAEHNQLAVFCLHTGEEIRLDN